MKSVLAKCLLSLVAVSAVAVCQGSAPAQPRAPRQQLLVGAWNYTPDASVTPVRGIARAVVRYQHPPGDFNWDAVYLDFEVDGKPVRDQKAVARLRELPVMDWVNVYWWRLVHDKAPDDFGAESVAKTTQLVTEARMRLKAAGLNDEVLDNILHVLDFEHWEQKEIPGANITKELPHAVNSCILFTKAMSDGGWKIGEKGGAANYNINHGYQKVALGGPPHNRLTPVPIPGSLDGRTTFVSGYLWGGPRGCMNEDELLDVIEKAPAPLWLALEDNQPGLSRILRRAKASGKVRLILLWGNGKSTEQTGDTGRNHREKKKGGCVDWMRQQDERIARVLGL